MGAEERLKSFFDYERAVPLERRTHPFKLDRVERALDLLGRPERGMRLLHVAGTKGKGSVSEWCARLLAGRGVRGVGLFTSPHLVRLHERIRLDGDEIPDGDLLAAVERVIAADDRRPGEGLTWFEAVFLAALVWYRERGAAAAVLETGLGGRLDATNAVAAHLSVITRIDYDHQEVLGDTLEQIAGEKAGIIKTAPVVALRQAPEVDRVIAAACASRGAPLDLVEVPAAPAGIPPSKWENAHLALAALRRFLPPGPLSSPAELAALPLPGRLQETTWHGRRLVLDAAHNPVSLRALDDFLATRAGPFSLVFAMGAGRDPRALLAAILPRMSEACLCTLPGGRPGVPPEDLARLARELRPDLPVSIARTGAEILARLRLAGEDCRVVTGSFHLVGEVLGHLAGDTRGAS